MPAREALTAASRRSATSKKPGSRVSPGFFAPQARPAEGRSARGPLPVNGTDLAGTDGKFFPISMERISICGVLNGDHGAYPTHENRADP
jgi:hypothetical protein